MLIFCKFEFNKGKAQIMKNNLLIVFLFFTTIMVSAQEKKDSFVKTGDQIEATFFHDNGQIAQTGNYNKQLKLHGEWISYDRKGLKTARAHYKNGEKVDTWMFYSDNVINEVTYINSKVTKVKTWEAKKVEVVSN